MADYEIFELGDVVLQCKKTLRNARLAYKTFVTLNAQKTTSSFIRPGFPGNTTRMNG